MQVRRGFLNTASRNEGARATFASIASGDKVCAGIRCLTQPWSRVASRRPGKLKRSLDVTIQVPMSRMEPDQDLRERYAAMEDRLSVRIHFSAVAAGLPMFLITQCIHAPAGCTQKAEQANDSCREGKCLQLLCLFFTMTQVAEAISSTHHMHA